MTANAGDGRAGIVAALAGLGLLESGLTPPMRPLTGGVSSDIWRVDLPDGRVVCVKRALARLKVAADWRAPVDRNAYEAAWMRAVAAIEPGAVPRLIAEDAAAGLFVMEFLEPSDHPVWKARLHQGDADTEAAAEVGRRLAHIHAATAGRAEVAEAFATDRIFHPIRVEPYLLATAMAHPDRAAALESIAESVMTTKKALVHGDVSPKNILLGPRGPVFIDAECAWYGEPAFDLSFCLNHMLLKCLWTPAAAPGFVACFVALTRAYLAGVTWEDPAALNARAARLLPGLFLGRVDGKSPAEYVTEEADKARVRRVARALLADPVDQVLAVAAAWKEEIAA